MHAIFLKSARFLNQSSEVLNMVSKRKKSYMKKYNQRAEVKARKAAYMRAKRAELAKQRVKEDVLAFLHAGFENQAFEHAKEFAPEMLLTIKAPNRKARGTS